MGIRNEDGQATVEHLGVVALVTLAMLAAGAISAVAAPGLFNRVSGGFQRALCIVTGQTCLELVREPCPERRQTDRASQGVAVGWLRLGHDRVLFIERRSDGSYLLSLMEGSRAGAGIGRGTSAAGAGADADAALTVGWKGGRQYVVATPAEARALVRRLRADPIPALSTEVAAALDVTGLRDADPAVDAYVLTGDAAADAVAQAGFKGLLGGGLELQSSNEVGVKIAAHRKEITAYVKADTKIGVFYDAFSGAGLRGKTRQPRPQPAQSPGPPDLSKRPAPPSDDAAPAGVEGQAATQSSTKPLEGAISGTISIRFGPGPRVLGVEVVVSASTASRQRELRMRLDPSEPAVASAIDRWRRDPTDADAVRSLGAAAAQYAALDDRTFALADDKDVQSLSGNTPGGSFGVDLTNERSLALLEEQRSRPSGGLWETRLDCGTGAAA